MKLPSRRKIFAVVGESRTNPDGKRRQDVLCDVEPGEEIQLLREPDNSYDSNAVRVVVGNDTVGYLSRDDAVELAPALDGGRSYRAVVHCIRGGVPDYPSYGCQVSVAWDDQPSHPHIPLDAQQLRSRRSKRSARTRRDSKSTHRPPKSGKSQGCVGILVLIVVPLSLLLL